MANFASFHSVYLTHNFFRHNPLSLSLSHTLSLYVCLSSTLWQSEYLLQYNKGGMWLKWTRTVRRDFTITTLLSLSLSLSLFISFAFFISFSLSPILFFYLHSFSWLIIFSLSFFFFLLFLCISFSCFFSFVYLFLCYLLFVSLSLSVYLLCIFISTLSFTIFILSLSQLSFFLSFLIYLLCLCLPYIPLSVLSSLCLSVSVFSLCIPQSSLSLSLSAFAFQCHLSVCLSFLCLTVSVISSPVCLFMRYLSFIYCHNGLHFGQRYGHTWAASPVTVPLEATAREY